MTRHQLKDGSRPATACVLLLVALVCVAIVDGGSLSSKIEDEPHPTVPIPEWAKPVPSAGKGKLTKSTTLTERLGSTAVKRTKVTYWFLGGSLYRVKREIEDLVDLKKAPEVEVVNLGFTRTAVNKETRELEVNDECYFGRAASNIEDLSGQPLWDGNPSPTDIRQGSLGNCWFLASLISIISAPSPLGPSVITKNTKMSGKKSVVVSMWDGHTQAKIKVPYTRANFNLQKGRLSHHSQNWAFMWSKAAAAYTESNEPLRPRLDYVEPACNPHKLYTEHKAELKLPTRVKTCHADHKDMVSNSAETAFRMILGPQYVTHQLDVEDLPSSGEYLDRAKVIVQWIAKSKTPAVVAMINPLPSGCHRYNIKTRQQESFKIQVKHAFSFQGMFTKSGEVWYHLRDPWGDSDNSEQPADFLIPSSSFWRCTKVAYYVDSPQFLKQGGSKLKTWRSEFLDTFE